MLLLELLLLFSLICVIRGFGYDDILRDDCFKKTFKCEDDRVSITEDMEHYVTDPEKFDNICRRHKDFLTCISEASDFCTEMGNITSFALMTLDNRISLRMFCKEPQWKKDYFASVPCINKYEKVAIEECNREEKERVENRPFWCQIPEPCVGLKRIFDCSVEKMKGHCGFLEAEIYKRLYYLKVEKQDVVCEFRRRNARYCRYSAPPLKPKMKPIVSEEPEIEKRSGQLSSSAAEVVRNLITLITSETISYLAGHSDTQNSEPNQSKTLKKSLVELYKMIEQDFDNEQYTETEFDFSKHLDSRNKKDVKLSSNLHSQYSSNKVLDDFCWTPGSNCFQSAKSSEDERILRTLENLPKEVEFIKDSILALYDLLKYEDSQVIRVGDGSIRLYWRNLDRFPLQTLSCKWQEISSEEVFKCDIKFKKQPLKQNQKFPEASKSSETKGKTNEKGSLADKQSGSIIDGDEGILSFDVSKIQLLMDLLNGEKPFDSSVYIHRTGDQFSEIILKSEDDSKEFKSSNLKLEVQSLDTETAENFDSPLEGENFVLLENPFSTESDIYHTLSDTTENLYTSISEQQTFDSEDQMKDSEFNSILAESLGVTEDYTSTERNKEQFQARELEDFLNERFKSVDTVSESETEELLSLANKLAKNYSIKDCPTDTSTTSKDNSMGIYSTESLKIKKATECYFDKSSKQSSNIEKSTSTSDFSFDKNLKSTNYVDSERDEL